MSKISRFVIAIAIPTIILYVWSLWAMSCVLNMTTGASRCSIPVYSSFDIPLIVFVLYAVFYGLANFISGYKIKKKK